MPQNGEAGADGPPRRPWGRFPSLPCRIIKPTNLLSGKLSSCDTGSCCHGNKTAYQPEPADTGRGPAALPGRFVPKGKATPPHPKRGLTAVILTHWLTTSSASPAQGLSLEQPRGARTEDGTPRGSRRALPRPGSRVAASGPRVLGQLLPGGSGGKATPCVLVSGRWERQGPAGAPGSDVPAGSQGPTLPPTLRGPRSPAASSWAGAKLGSPATCAPRPQQRPATCAPRSRWCPTGPVPTTLHARTQPEPSASRPTVAGSATSAPVSAGLRPRDLTAAHGSVGRAGQPLPAFLFTTFAVAHGRTKAGGRPSEKQRQERSAPSGRDHGPRPVAAHVSSGLRSGPCSPAHPPSLSRGALTGGSSLRTLGPAQPR